MSAEKRDLNEESRDVASRAYAYDFDWVIRRYLLNRVTPLLEQSGATLEVGAFKGDMTAQILMSFPNLTVLEGSSVLAAKLRERFGDAINVHFGLVENSSFVEEFDTIFLVHTLEHLENRIAALSQMSTWLKEDGQMIVAVPNGHALSRRIAVAMGLIRTHCSITPAEWEHGHRITYSIDSFLSDLRDSGLIVEEWGGVLLKPLSNVQFDQALSAEIVGEEYLQALDDLARQFPDLSATLFAVCRKP